MTVPHKFKNIISREGPTLGLTTMALVQNVENASSDCCITPKRKTCFSCNTVLINVRFTGSYIDSPRQENLFILLGTFSQRRARPIQNVSGKWIKRFNCTLSLFWNLTLFRTRGQGAVGRTMPLLCNISFTFICFYLLGSSFSNSPPALSFPGVFRGRGLPLLH